MMELEFDKEIDAILRKARDGVGLKTAAVVAAASPHLDADTIAAFVENALPEKAKLLYTNHFADCDKCRRILSQSIMMNSEAEVMAAHSVVSAPVAAPHVAWYLKLFKTQNLALAMGALVLTFGALLGFFALQNRNSLTENRISQVTEPEPRHGGLYNSGELTQANSNTPARSTTLANSMSNAANTMPSNSSSTISGPSANVAPGTTGRLDSVKEKEPAPGLFADKSVSTADTSTGSSGKTLANASSPPPKTGADQPEVRAETKPAPAKPRDEKDDDARSERGKASEDRLSREMPAAAMKKGPARSGPMQNQTQKQLNNNDGEMPATRNVGGKTFHNRDGAWYDLAYHSQKTSDYRRATDDYKKLDGGLRRIADTLGGTVVLVWKNKAYRIQ